MPDPNGNHNQIRTHRNLSPEDITLITGTYHVWRGDASPFQEGEGTGVRVYSDEPGFCKSTTLDAIRSHGYVLMPGRYVGTAEVEDDGEPFAEKMARLTVELEGRFAESVKYEEAIRASLSALGFTLEKSRHAA